MCYCNPNIRTPYCNDCGWKMRQDLVCKDMEIERLNQIITAFSRYFKSGNDIEVEKAVIPKKDFDAIMMGVKK